MQRKISSYQFITYGNEKYRRSKKRLISEVKKLNIFDKVIAYGPEDFETDFEEKHMSFIEKNSRGGGYWLWKPYFIVKTLENMNNDDILIYADAGCKIYPQHKKRLYKYFDIVRKSNFGLLTFQLRPQDYKGVSLTIEYIWTKSDLAKRMGVLDDKRIMNSHQICGTLVVIRKCEHSMKILKEWYSICSQGYHFIDDSPSAIPNHPDFVEHRHDQSVLSLCVKKYGSEILPDKTYIKGASIISKERINDDCMMPKMLLKKIKGQLKKIYNLFLLSLKMIIKI